MTSSGQLSLVTFIIQGIQTFLFLSYCFEETEGAKALMLQNNPPLAECYKQLEVFVISSGFNVCLSKFFPRLRHYPNSLAQKNRFPVLTQNRTRISVPHFRSGLARTTTTAKRSASSFTAMRDTVGQFCAPLTSSFKRKLDQTTHPTMETPPLLTINN